MDTNTAFSTEVERKVSYATRKESNERFLPSVTVSQNLIFLSISV